MSDTWSDVERMYDANCFGQVYNGPYPPQANGIDTNGGYYGGNGAYYPGNNRGAR
jgi:hypothetical protein